MDTYFELLVVYKGQELELHGRLAAFGYTYRFIIQLGDLELVVEKDEQGDLRALLPAEQAQVKQPDPELVAAVVHSLQQVL